MNRHPPFINYGNALPVPVPPDPENVSAIAELERNPMLVDYPHRRFYKIDWKVCMMHYWHAEMAKRNNGNVSYHAMVEDDSFMCTEHVLHLLAILERRLPKDQDSLPPSTPESFVFGNGTINRANPWRRDQHPRQNSTRNSGPLPFRTGTANYDGFDDSSTLMSASVGRSFVDNYRYDEFLGLESPNYLYKGNPTRQYLEHGEQDWNCPLVPKVGGNHSASTWLSWGNSWQTQLCGWRRAVEHGRRVALRINQPIMHCLSADLETLRSHSNAQVRNQQKQQQQQQQQQKRLHQHSGLRNQRVSETETDTRLLTYSSAAPTAPPPPPPPLSADICRPAYPLVFHHPKAATVLRGLPPDPIAHVCEAMLLIDKVKSPEDVTALWLAATGNAFVDYSEVFLHDKYLGWHALLSKRDNSTRG